MPNTKPTKNYEELRSELDDIMLELQREDIDVDKALINYQRGLELLSAIEAYLKSAGNKVSELKAKYKME
jgi:exodeoxyribonuclease VII small subunit